jgi:hypothetical protein
MNITPIRTSLSKSNLTFEINLFILKGSKRKQSNICQDATTQVGYNVITAVIVKGTIRKETD